MIFAYQFPERTNTLALIASGGLGPELNIALRSATLLNIALAARTLAALTPSWLGRLAQHGAVALGLAPRTDLDTVGRALDSLADQSARQVFLHTLRGAVNWSGQRLDGIDRPYHMLCVPTSLIAGRWEPCIPYHHTLRAHVANPGSKLVVLPGGHFPHTEWPQQIVNLLASPLTTSLGRSPSGALAARLARERAA